MNGPLRSKQGCWTCRLRKKKCDEKHPLCSTCEALAITCYGYGPKPDWMDNGEKEKAMAHSIKQVVKHTSRRKGRLGISLSQLQKRHDSKKAGFSVVKIAPKSTSASSSSPASNIEPDPLTGESNSPVQSTNAHVSTSPSAEPVREYDHTRESSSMPAVSGNESILLMHFLDNVFCLQYPLYRPKVVDGGRGWLLSLLLRTKPLYHASLALSAYHRSMIFVAERRCPQSANEQQEHLVICLEELQRSIKNVRDLVSNSCPNNSVGLLASSVQLIFFELFASQGESWNIHLSAATGIFRGRYKLEMKALGLKELNSTSDEDKGRDGHEFPKSEEVVIFRFLAAVIAYLDIINSVLSGKLPQVLRYLPDEVSNPSGIKLESVMGCKNWAMLQMGLVSGLQEYKAESVRQGYFNIEEFDCRAGSIKRELQNGLAESSLSFLSISETKVATSCNPFITPQMFATQLFALAASIYLHLVLFGYQQDSDALNTMVSEAVKLIHRHLPADLTHALVCPLYIIASAARTEDEALFRHIFSSPPLMDPSLEHRARLLPLLARVWALRETGWGWETNIQLAGSNLLLI